MSNYVMRVDLFGSEVRCDTDGFLVSLNDLLSAGNKHRAANEMPVKNMYDIVSTKGFKEFVDAVESNTKIPKDKLIKTVKGRNGRTMAHIYIAVYVAEQMSPAFHVEVIKTFTEQKILEYRVYGGSEFNELNKHVDAFLPGRDGKNNKGIYINLAKILRRRILRTSGDDLPNWGNASAEQTMERYEKERKLCEFLKHRLVRDWDHLKELAEMV